MILICFVIMEHANFGRRRVPWWGIDARRNYSGFVLVGAQLSSVSIGFLLPSPGRLSIKMEGMVLPWILWFGLLGVLQKGSFSAWSSWYLGWGWVVVAATPITCHDIELWPYSVGMLLKWVAFLYTLHWPQSGADLGVGGVSYVELLILYELWAGERLDLEKAVPRYRRVGRSISVSAVPFGPGTEIWRSRRYIGALFRALVAVPGGVRRFVSCEVGANHCRLRHIGWERCGHGLTSRPRDPGLAGFVWLSFWVCCCVIGWGVTPSVLFW